MIELIIISDTNIGNDVWYIPRLIISNNTDNGILNFILLFNNKYTDIIVSKKDNICCVKIVVICL